MADAQVVESVVHKLSTGRLDEAQLVCEIAAFEKFESFKLLYAACFAAQQNFAVLKIILEDDRHVLRVFLDAVNSAAQPTEDVAIPSFGRYIISRLNAFKAKESFVPPAHDYIAEYEKSLLGTDDILKILSQSKHLDGYRAQLLLAEQYFRSAEYYKARLCFEDAFVRNPYSSRGFDKYSTTLWHLRDKEALLKLSLLTKNRFSDRSETAVVLGNYASLMGLQKQAIKILHQPSSSYSLCLEGYEWLTCGNLDQAEKCFKHAKTIDRSEFTASFGLGLVGFKRNNRVQALEHFLHASMINPNCPNSRYYSALLLEQAGDLEAALQVLVQSERPSSSLFSEKMARILMEKGDLPKAEGVLCSALELHPLHGSLHLALAEIKKQQADPSGALKHLKRANELELSSVYTREFIDNLE